MSEPLKTGDIVERYRVESVLGQGGTARVYRVRHTTLETVHALKVLTLDHPEIRARLIAEGKAQAKLAHDNIVPVRDVLDHDGAPALLMDFVPGPSLASKLQAGLLHPDEVIRLFRLIVSGVAYAHDKGLVHRDLKPGNVLLDVSKDPAVPKVTDFGLVRLLHPPEGQERQTAVGVAMGTLGYMAPEQLRDAHSADVRTDIFALGALLYAMLVGRAPFTGADQLEVMNSTASGTYTPLSQMMGPQLGRGLDELVSQCLRVDPQHRYQSAREILVDLWVPNAPDDPGQTMSWVADAPRLPPPTEEQGLVQSAPEKPSAEPTIVSGQEGTVLPALIVDTVGQGHQVELSVVLDSGGEGIQHPPNVGRDAEVAAQLAFAVALGRDAESFGARWMVRGFTAEIQGTSLGLPLAVAIWSAANGRALPDGVAFTGGMDLDGRVAPVSGVPAKLRAATSAGSHSVYVPADGLGQLSPPRGLNVVPVRRFETVIERLFPSPTVRGGLDWKPRYLVFLIPLLMALTSLTARVEPLVHDPLLRAINGALPADNTAILAFPPQRDARALRPQHPAVIDALVDAGAKAIFFDVILLAETEHDTAIAAAIKRAFSSGVPVILPLMTENQEVLFPEADALRDAAWFGAVLAQTDTTFWHVRRAPMRVRSVEGGEYWHAAAQTVRGHLGVDDAPRIEAGHLIIGPNRNPVWADLSYLHPTDPSPVIAYGLDGDLSVVRGRSVLVGEMGGADDVHRTGSGAVYGVEIEATLIETLLQQKAPRLASPEINALWALIVGIFTTLLGLSLPRSRRKMAVAVPVVGCVVGGLLVMAGVLVAFGPMLVSSTLALWLVLSDSVETKR